MAIFIKRGMKKNYQKIYLDYAATTPIDPRVLKKMFPFLKENFGNPSSIHQFGQKALFAIDKAREKIANFLGAFPSEIIFTGSATEANNLAIIGTYLARKKKQKKLQIITSKIEHHAVLDCCKFLEKEGVKIVYLPPTKEGKIELSKIKKAISKDTFLISIMYANNEIGTIQPIEKIGNFIEKINKKRREKIYFHTDAVQAINYLDCNVKKLKVDLLTISAHKIYGPKGVGALFVKKGTEISPLIYGGGQEKGLRSGTENVAGIVGLGKAIELVKKERKSIKKIKKLKDKIIKRVLKEIPDVKLNSPQKESLPNIINFSFKGVEGESIVMALDQKGIACSTGSACSSKSLEPSHVLLAIGLSPELSHSSLRVSLGKYTKEKEVDFFLKVLPKIIQNLRKLSPFYGN